MRDTCALILPLLAMVLAPPVRAQEEPCAAATHRQFDFWLGEWEIEQGLLLEDGSWLLLPASSTVSRAVGNCALQEEWRGQVRFFWEGMAAAAPLEALSVRAYDPEAGVWRIWWLDSRRPQFGAPFEGGFDRGEGVFLRAGSSADGEPLLTRIRFYDIATDSVRWELAISRDSGSSWAPLWRMRFRRARSRGKLLSRGV